MRHARAAEGDAIPMKILFLSQGYPPTNWYYGVSTYTPNAARGLAALGHEVHVLDCFPRYRPKDELDESVIIHRRTVLRVRGARRLLRLLPGSIGRSIRRRLASYRPDRILRRLNEALSYYLAYRRLGVEFDVVQAPNGSLGLLFALLRSAPLVVNLHCPPLLDLDLPADAPRGWRTRIAGFLDRLTARRATLLTSPSHLMVETLRDRRWLDSQEPRVIPNSIDEELWSSVGSIRDTGPVVLAVGKLEAVKAQEILVEAAARLRHQIDGLEVQFVGGWQGERDGRPYVEWVEDLARKLGSPCRFAGKIPRPDLVRYYGRARVVAIPSRFDSFSHVGLEAMLCGRPVVCTSRVGLVEALSGSGACSVVPPEDPEALADALLPYLEDPEKAAEAGERARAQVSTVLSGRRIALQREAAYREAVRRWRAQRVRISWS